MQSHRILSGLTIFLMVVLVAVGYFVVAQPQLASAADAGLQMTSLQSQIAQSETAVVQLKAEQKNLPTLRSKLSDLRLSIPSSVDNSAYINGLTAVASAAGVTITALSVGDAQAYVPPAGAPVATTPSAAAGATPTPTPSASASAAPEPATTGWVPTTDPLITAGNFVTIPVKVSVSGTFDGGLAFMKGLQSGTRLFLITGFSTAEAADGSGVTTEIGGFIYVLLDPSATAPASTTVIATPSATPTPTAPATTDPSGTATPTPTQSPTPTKKP